MVFFRSNVTTAAPEPTTPAPTNITTAFGSNREFSIYDISFYWYKVLGVLLIFIWAVPMSYVWPLDKNEKQNPKLYSPFVRKMLKVPDPVVELEELPLKGSSTQAEKAKEVEGE